MTIQLLTVPNYDRNHQAKMEINMIMLTSLNQRQVFSLNPRTYKLFKSGRNNDDDPFILRGGNML